MPTKFGYDKRKLHLSSAILSGQLTREQALAELAEPLCEAELKEDFEYVAKKLGLSNDELKKMVETPGVSYKEYPNWDSRYRMLKKLQAFIERLRGKKVKSYGKVAHLSSAHPRYDTRIFIKMCSSLAQNGYEVSLVIADGKGDEVKSGYLFLMSEQLTGVGYQG